MKNWKSRISITVLVHFLCAEMIMMFFLIPYNPLEELAFFLDCHPVLKICYKLFFYLISAFTLWKLVIKNLDTKKHKKFGMIIRTLLISAAAIYVMYVIAMFINGLIYVYF